MILTKQGEKMPGFQAPITVYQAIESIKNNDYLLPAFQREFVWKASQIERLFDSLLQGYPISSMLFWKVKGSTTTDFNFYQFLNSFVEKYKTHNELQRTITKDFYAILDGQQRLTALYLGLCGTYAYHEFRKSWENSPSSFPERTLYLCLSKENKDEEIDRKYIFEFKKLSETNKKDIFIDAENEIWFNVNKIISLHLNVDFDIDDFCDENNLNKEHKKMIRRLDNAIFVNPNINYYEEDDQNPDKAVNVFTRINSGGTYLSFSDIMFSLMVANWKKDARTEITQLVDNINDKGFSINTDYVLKAFLLLCHRSVKSSINNFSKKFCNVIEDNWDNIRDAIYSLFDLLHSFGLTSSTLTSNNATLPILYYLYHTEKYKNFTSSVAYKEDRGIIKKWLYQVLIRRAFGSQSDSVLALTRKVFTKDVEKSPIENNSQLFPAQELLDSIKNHLTIMDDDFIDELLHTQKDNKYCFAILSLLYPNMDYVNNNFHKDHIHAEALYKNLPDEIKKKYSFDYYNSIVNLQMLDANENESKGKKSLNQWVTEELKSIPNRKQFFDAHIIPDIDLSLENFDQFYQERKKLLSDKLKSIL